MSLDIIWPMNRSNRITRSLPMKTTIFAALAWPVLFAGNSFGQTTIFSTGLTNPTKVICLGGGNLLVAETPTALNSGRVSFIDPAGTRHTVLDGLPSGPSAPDGTPDGPNGLALSGSSLLYIGIGEGDTHVSGPTPNTIIPNPSGPSSPIFDTVLSVTFSAPISNLAAGFTLSLANQSTLADGKAVILNNGFNQSATIQLVGALRVDRPDPITIYRNAHLYNLAISTQLPAQLYLDDAGDNAIWRLDLRSSVPTILTRFPNIVNPAGSLPPSSEAVPTSVHAYDGHLLVTEFSGAPFIPGHSSVVTVDLDTGAVAPLVSGLSFAIDALQLTFGPNPQALILEYTTNLLSGATGQLLVYSGRSTSVLASGLPTPTSMAVDLGRSAVFITNSSGGQILEVQLP
jgi:hypothetical protein